MSTRVYEPPTDEQLANFIAVQVLGPNCGQFGKALCRELVKKPTFRESWLKQHRDLQEELWTHSPTEGPQDD